MSSKRKICDKFNDKLKELRINFIRHSVYHFQIQVEHNFYPTTEVYYNSRTGERCAYKQFETHSELMKFLREKTHDNRETT